MHRPLLGCALALVLSTTASALAQPYPGITPVPRTTDPARLHALAAQREIIERIRIGVGAERRSQWSAAVPEFEAALRLEPHEPQGSTAAYDLGLALAHLERYADAATAFRRAIARDPGFLAARANLVSVELDADDIGAARSAADAFVAAAPESARALYARGIAALRARDAATALRDFQALLGNDPAYAVAHYDLALAEQQLGRFSDAERELRAALGLVPNYGRARLALGAVLLREGKRDDARSTFDAVANAPSDDVTLRNLAVSLRDAIRP